MTVQNVSIILFCNNDEINIKKNIEDLSFASEIILIDNNSTDYTAAAAKELGVTLLEQNDTSKFEIQKQAVESAKNNWIILLDSKDNLSQELQNELTEKINNQNAAACYFAGETLFFFGKTIKYGAFFNKKRLLLFDRNRHSYSENLKVTLFDGSKPLKNKINSFAYKSFDNFNTRLHLIRKEEALVLFHKNVKPNFYHFFMKPFFIFIHQYFLKFGFIDGKEGFILAYINSFSILRRYLILWLLYRKMD